MTVIDQNVVTYWVNRTNAAANSTAKGREWQRLGCYVFRRIPGVSLLGRNVIDPTGAREFDIAFKNLSARVDFGFIDYAFLVECKALRRRVQSEHVQWFHDKLREFGVRHGIILSKLGIAGDERTWTDGYDVVRLARRAGFEILSLNLQEVRSCATSDDLVALCQRKWMRLHLFLR